MKNIGRLTRDGDGLISGHPDKYRILNPSVTLDQLINKNKKMKIKNRKKINHSAGLSTRASQRGYRRIAIERLMPDGSFPTELHHTKTKTKIN